MSAELLLSADRISVALGGRSVLSDVSVALHAGEVVTLIGPNGAGKTTLLRALLGLIAPNAGRVAMRPGLVLGYMPQRLTLDEALPLTVGRFLALAGPLAAAGTSAVAAETGITHLLDRPVQSTSGGEMQRVLLARALMRAPQALVLDEPGQNLDAAGQAELFVQLDAIRKRRGCGVLMVTHDLHVVMAAADRVICLNHHVCCTGRPEAMRDHPEFLALFPQGLPDAIAPYLHHHDHGHLPSGEVDSHEAGHAHAGPTHA
ncbi:MAG: ATP-binding cassette domain-containing protein [Alphaproteobacteria bacterium]|nr:ATP-binding cassette domain-containing protein [Alphaproteobacteria bacterium]